MKFEEAERLISTAMEKAVKGELEYDPRFGWLKEGSFDYIRHVVTRYIENYLEEQGIIATLTMYMDFSNDTIRYF